jgi:hypothetical protein
MSSLEWLCEVCEHVSMATAVTVVTQYRHRGPGGRGVFRFVRSDELPGASGEPARNLVTLSTKWKDANCNKDLKQWQNGNYFRKTFLSQ